MSKPITITVDTLTKQVVENYSDISKGDILSITFKMFQNSVALDLTGQKIHIILDKKDGNSIEKIITGITGNEFTSEFNEQATLSIGEVEGQILLIDSMTKKQNSSNKFVFEVGNSLGSSIITKSANDIQTLIDLEKILDASISAEVIESRGIYAKLKDRLNNSDSVLGQNTKKIEYEKLSKTLEFNHLGFIPYGDPPMHLQSICYIPSENAILVAHNNLDTNINGTIIKYNLDTLAVIQTYENILLGHANDMTYNPLTNEILIACMYSANGKNAIYIYDYSTMTLKSNQIISCVEADYIIGVAYDKENDRYLFYNGLKIYITDNSFNLISSFDAPRDGYIVQSMDIANDLIYISCINLIMVYSIQGAKIRRYETDTSGETEGLAYIGNNAFLVGNQVNVDSIRKSSVRLQKFNMYVEYNPFMWHTYKSLEEIGIVTGTETIENICNAMPNNSKLIYDKIVANAATCYPTSSGRVEVIKKDTSKVSLKFYNGLTTAKPYLYYGNFNSNLTPKFSGWEQLALNSEVKVFVGLSDIGLASSDMTTDFSTNVNKIITTIGRNRKIILYAYSSESNLNLYNSIKSWCGVDSDAYRIVIDTAYTTDVTISPNIIEVFPNSNGISNKRLFGYYDNALSSCKEMISKSDFYATLSPSGYQKLPSGLIIQWGAYSAIGTITFPTAFTTAVYAVVPVSASATASYVNAKTLSNFTIAGGTAGTFIAIGY